MDIIKIYESVYFMKKIPLNPENRTRFFLRGDEYDVGLMNFLEQKELRKIFNAKRFRIKDIDMTYRVINHWTELGLIDDLRKDNQKWKEYSLIDLCWIRIILSLREMGLANETIKKAKKFLLPTTSSENHLHEKFEYYVSISMMGIKTFVVVFSDGEADLVASYELTKREQQSGLPSLGNFIRLDFNKIVFDVLGKGEELIPMDIDLKAKEIQLLLDVRQGKYKSIEVHMKNGEIVRFEKKANRDEKERIIEILKENKFQEITIKQQDGKIVSISQTVKEK